MPLPRWLAARAPWTVLACAAACGGGAGEGEAESEAEAEAESEAEAEAEGEPAGAPVEVSQSCTAATPCAGDPTGRWRLTEACLPILDAPCPGGSISVEDLHMDEVIEFAAGGAFARTVDVQGDFDMFLPTACLGGFPCEQVGMQFGSGDLRCAPEGTGCRCRGPATDHVQETGTWSVTGDALEIQVPSPDPGDPEFTATCRAGGELTLIGASRSTGAPATARYRAE